MCDEGHTSDSMGKAGSGPQWFDTMLGELGQGQCV